MEDEQAQSPFSPQLFYFICSIGMIAILGSTMAKNPTLTLFSSQLGVPEWQLGIIAAIGPIPGILLSAPAGAFGDRWGQIRVIQISLFFFASAPFLYLFVTEPWQLIPIRFFHGLATAIFGPVILSFIARHYPFERAGRMSLFSSLTMISRVIAPLFAGLLISTGSIFIVYLVCGLSGVIALILGLTIPHQQMNLVFQTQSLKTVPGSLWRTISNHNIFLTSSMEAVLYFAIGAFETFLPKRMEFFNWDPLLIGFVMACQIGAIILIKPLMGIISDRWQRKTLIVIGLLVCTCSFLLLGFFQNFVIFCIASLIFGSGIAISTASTSALVSDFSQEQEYGSAIGTLSSIMDVGHSLGPIVCGFVISSMGFSIAYFWVAALIIIGAIFFTVSVQSAERIK
ncbi:MAG: MFS transporter [Candidatus Hodarchaeales archaeon]|jgi:MFS family permease